MSKRYLKYIKSLLLLISVLVSIFYFLNINITREYPVEKVCKHIINFNKTNGRFPTKKEFFNINIPSVGLFSYLQYKVSENDFIFYFAPMFLSPAEVCQSNGIVYYDEI